MRLFQDAIKSSIRANARLSSNCRVEVQEALKQISRCFGRDFLAGAIMAGLNATFSPSVGLWAPRLHARNRT